MKIICPVPSFPPKGQKLKGYSEDRKAGYDGREDEIMQDEEVEQENIDPREELQQQGPGDSRKLF